MQKLKVFEEFFTGGAPIPQVLDFIPGFWKVSVLSNEEHQASTLYFQEVFIVKMKSVRPLIILWKRKFQAPVIIVTPDCELVDYELRDELNIDFISGNRIDKKYLNLVIDSILGRYRLRLDLVSFS